jgi:uncharacterized protein (TIGR00661 family)
MFYNLKMKILYAIQGTGNGHLARATEIVPLLKELAEADVLVSGTQADINLPFTIEYKFRGLSFVFGKTGGIDILKTIFKLRPLQFINDITKLPVKNYDLIITDFEPVSSWACKIQRKTCIGLSHQNAVLHPVSPKPEKSDWLGKFILKNYAPAKVKYGFHFKQLDNSNYTPVIRKTIRNARPENKGHYTVYLPAYSNVEIEKVLSSFPQVRWEVFSKHSKQTYEVGKILFQPVSLENFNHSFIHCEGVLCTAGFETPAEAIFMGKKLCVVPMKNQYEQACNALFLAEMGITVISDFSSGNKQLKLWIENKTTTQIKYPDHTREILKEILLRTLL